MAKTASNRRLKSVPPMAQRLVFTVFVMAIICACAPPAAGREYKLVIPVAEGLGESSLKPIFEGIAKGIYETSGIRIKPAIWRFRIGDDTIFKLLEEMNKNKIDLGMVMSQEYIRYLLHQKSNAIPAFTINFFGSTTNNVCAFVRKTDGISSIKQLKGKILGGSHILPALYLLNENGIDEPLGRFFNRVLFFNEIPPSLLYDAIIAKKIDVVIANDLNFKASVKANPQYKEIRMIGCMEYEHNMFFVYRKGLPEADVKKLIGVVLTAHANKAFDSLKFLFTVVQGHFVEVDVKKLKNTKRIVELAEKNGWYKEQEEFLKKYAK